MVLSEMMEEQTCLMLLIGQEHLKVENYKKIIKYNPNEIILLILKSKLKIVGKHLNIEYFNEDEISILGEILSITFEN